MKVLLDPSVRRNAVTHKTVAAEKRVKWGPTTHEVEVAARKPAPPRLDEPFRRAQLPYIAALPDLVSSGRLTLFRSPEIFMEYLRNRPADPGYFGVDLLEGVPIETAPTPVERIVIFAGNGASIGITKDEQVEFLRSLGDPRFDEIRRAVGNEMQIKAMIGDAFHYWTAEHAGLDAYLTMDGKFVRHFRSQVQGKIAPRSEVLTPEELCERLRAKPVDVEQFAAKRPPFS